MEEVKYSIADFAGQSRKMFDAAPEAVTVALRLGGKDSYTIDEAKAVVKEFLETEVN